MTGQWIDFACMPTASSRPMPKPAFWRIAAPDAATRAFVAYCGGATPDFGMVTPDVTNNTLVFADGERMRVRAIKPGRLVLDMQPHAPSSRALAALEWYNAALARGTFPYLQNSSVHVGNPRYRSEGRVLTPFAASWPEAPDYYCAPACWPILAPGYVADMRLRWNSYEFRRIARYADIDTLHAFAAERPNEVDDVLADRMLEAVGAS